MFRHSGTLRSSWIPTQQLKSKKGKSQQEDGAGQSRQWQDECDFWLLSQSSCNAAGVRVRRPKAYWPFPGFILDH